MTFSGCGSYCKDTCNYDEYIASYNVQYVLNKLEGIMTAFKCQIVWFLFC